MKKIIVFVGLLLVAAVLARAQTAFEYLSGYPKGCSDTGPASEYVGGSYNFGNLASCTIPGLRPPGTFIPPSPGGSYVDPTFGRMVTVAAPVGYYQTYSTPSPLSATGKYLAVSGRDADGTIAGLSAIVGPKTSAWVKKIAGASQDWGFWWHPTDDDVYYTINAGNIVQRSVTKAGETVVLNLAGQSLQFRHGGTGDIAPDLWLSFASGAASGALDRVCAAKLDGGNKIYCIPFAEIGMSNYDFTMMSKGADSGTGKRYILAEQAGGAILSVDFAENKLKLEYKVPNVHWNHSDTMQGPDGRQYLFGSYGGGPAFWPLGVHDPIKQQNWEEFGGSIIATYRDSWQSPVIAGAGSTHYNCAKTAPVCVVGHSPNSVAKGADAPGEFAPFGYEAITLEMTGDRKFTVKRLAKIRSVRYLTDPTMYDNDYDSMPMCALSGDASTVSCKTNFGFVPTMAHEQIDGTQVRRSIMITVPPPDPPSVFVWRFVGGTLPQGLSLSQDGQIAGTAIGAPGIYAFDVEASLPDGSAQAVRSTHTITVTEPPPLPPPPPPPAKIVVTSPADLGQVEQGQPFSYQLQAQIA